MYTEKENKNLLFAEDDLRKIFRSYPSNFDSQQIDYIVQYFLKMYQITFISDIFEYWKFHAFIKKILNGDFVLVGDIVAMIVRKPANKFDL
jgi:hypothetical protein